jgi:hypothetical protein
MQEKKHEGKYIIVASIGLKRGAKPRSRKATRFRFKKDSGQIRGLSSSVSKKKNIVVASGGSGHLP